MKKIFAVLFLISFLAVLAAPLVTSAQVADCCKVRRTFEFETISYVKDTCYAATGTTACFGCPGITLSSTNWTESWGMVCILNSIYRVADLAFAILLAVSILLILLSAFTFMTAGGDAAKVNKARDYILYALVGLIVAFLARAIPSIVKMLI
ncbi:hypothetical protein KJ636_00150 [Patescibacteria group bacterium]|nr:hypothetical protein [Patescibacteria group bacterium]